MSPLQLHGLLDKSHDWFQIAIVGTSTAWELFSERFSPSELEGGASGDGGGGSGATPSQWAPSYFNCGFSELAVAMAAASPCTQVAAALWNALLLPPPSVSHPRGAHLRQNDLPPLLSSGPDAIAGHLARLAELGACGPPGVTSGVTSGGQWFRLALMGLLGAAERPREATEGVIRQRARLWQDLKLDPPSSQSLEFPLNVKVPDLPLCAIDAIRDAALDLFSTVAERAGNRGHSREVAAVLVEAARQALVAEPSSAARPLPGIAAPPTEGDAADQHTMVSLEGLARCCSSLLPQEVEQGTTSPFSPSTLSSLPPPAPQAGLEGKARVLSEVWSRLLPTGRCVERLLEDILTHLSRHYPYPDACLDPEAQYQSELRRAEGTSAEESSSSASPMSPKPDGQVSDVRHPSSSCPVLSGTGCARVPLPVAILVVLMGGAELMASRPEAEHLLTQRLLLFGGGGRALPAEALMLLLDTLRAAEGCLRIAASRPLHSSSSEEGSLTTSSSAAVGTSGGVADGSSNLLLPSWSLSALTSSASRMWGDPATLSKLPLPRQGFLSHLLALLLCRLGPSELRRRQAEVVPPLLAGVSARLGSSLISQVAAFIHVFLSSCLDQPALSGYIVDLCHC